MSATPDTVLGIVREVLAAPSVRLDDDLYELGLDSLRIMQTAARVTERLGVDLPLSVYFDAATAADLVSAVEAATPAP